MENTKTIKELAANRFPRLPLQYGYIVGAEEALREVEKFLAGLDPKLDLAAAKALLLDRIRQISQVGA